MQNAINFVELGSRLTTALRTFRANPLQERRRSGVLVILDVHGVLVEKTATKDKDRKRAALTRRRHWRTFKNNATVWLRPNLSLFFDTLYARHDVAIWSSAIERNIVPLLNAIDAEYAMKPSLMDRLTFLWDRERCREDFQSGKYSTVKRVDDVWMNKVFQERYSAENTLLLDDSPLKVRHFPDSSIIVPEYTALSLGEQYNNDDTLLWLLLYIEYLVAEASKSVASTQLDISAIRQHCLSFKAFMLAGKLEAKQIAGEQDLCNLDKSLALVFLQDSNDDDGSDDGASNPMDSDDKSITSLPNSSPSKISSEVPVPTVKQDDLLLKQLELCHSPTQARSTLL